MKPLAALLALVLTVGGLATPAAAATPARSATATQSTAVVQSTSPTPRPTDPIAHDPTMVRDGGWYYVVITGDSGSPNTYLPMKRSRDLIHWQEIGPVFTALPAWVISELGFTPADAWGPKLARIGNQWALYYAASQFATNNSVIGLATTPTLDPDSPDYHWTDRGMVLRSTPGVDDINAIDPDYVTDSDGNAWLAFGSFWGGITMRRLDNRTGLLDATDTTAHLLAQRISPDAEEGPAIVRHGGYYYLFLSFDYCCRGVESDYRMVVGRSRSITGPYVDAAGVKLTDGGGTEVLRGYNEFIGTGGGDVWSDARGTYLVNHYYDGTDGGTPRLNVRPVAWRDGWPAVGDALNPSREPGHGDAYVAVFDRTQGLALTDVNCGYEGADISVMPYKSGNTCQQWQFGDRGNDTESLLNRFSNKVAEVAGCDNVDGGRVAQWGWIGFLGSNDCQRWQAVPTSAGPTSDGPTSDGPTSAGPTGDGWTRVQSVLTGNRVLEVANCGTAVVVDTVGNGACQEFRFQPIGQVLLVGGAPSLTPAHRWTFTPAGGASYTVRDARTGLFLGSDLRLSHQRRAWTVTPRTDGTWNLTTADGGVTEAVRLLLP